MTILVALGFGLAGLALLVIAAIFIWFYPMPGTVALVVVALPVLAFVRHCRRLARRNTLVPDALLQERDSGPQIPNDQVMGSYLDRRGDDFPSSLDALM